MNNLTFYLKNGIKLAANKRGEIFVTLNGYISLSGKPKQTISERTTRAFLAGTVFETPLKTEENGRMRLRNHKLIPLALACEWLAKDNPELAKAVDGDLMGWLSQLQDLSQFHKVKSEAVESIMQIPITGHQVVPTTQLAPATNNLERYERDGIELVIDQVTGEAWATVRGYARMSGKPQSTVQSRIDRMPEGERNTLTKIAAIDTQQGINGERINTQDVRLVPASLVFKWSIKDNPALAEAMGDAGATIYMHQLAGFKVTSDAIAKPQSRPTPPPQPPQLTSAERVKLAVDLKSVIEFSGLDKSNPRFAQQIQDLFGDVLGLTPHPRNWMQQLPPT